MWKSEEIEQYRLAWLRPMNGGAGPKLFFTVDADGTYCIHAVDGTEISKLTKEQLVNWLNEHEVMLVW